jgi:hypothetical protein
LIGSTFFEAVLPTQSCRFAEKRTNEVQLGALGFQELRGNHYFYSSVGLLHTLSEEPAALLGKVSAIAYYEVGDAFDSKANPFNDVAGGILSRTKLGVLFFGASVGESGRHKFYFSLGGFF